MPNRTISLVRPCFLFGRISGETTKNVWKSEHIRIKIIRHQKWSRKADVPVNTRILKSLPVWSVESQFQQKLFGEKSKTVE